MPASDWLAETRHQPLPRMLFGQFWLEGELAILFADTGAGKSILAVQIAESLARGRPIDPLPCTSRPQKVLYFDFELTGKQFEMRYTREPREGDTHLKRHYAFSRNFLRAEVDANLPLPENVANFEDLLVSEIESQVRRTGARVLILDNITYLRSGAVRMGEAIRLMRRLRQLKTELGLSILVLAHTPKRCLRGPLTVNDLQGSKMLANFADNIFAIGQSGYDSSHRYIKHIKPRSTEMIYDSAHVPTFALGKQNGNFLSFRFIGYREEKIHLSTKFDNYRRDQADRMKRMSAKGHTQREIAARFGVSAASVNRYLQMWSPFDDHRDDYIKELERQRLEEESEQTEDALQEDEQSEDELCCDGRHEECCGRYGFDPQEVDGSSDPPPDPSSDPAAGDPACTAAGGGNDFSAEDLTPGSQTEMPTPPSPDDPPEAMHDYVRRLPRGLDNNQEQVFVEYEWQGKLMIWYLYDSKGFIRKMVRKTFGINITILWDAGPLQPAGP